MNDTIERLRYLIKQLGIEIRASALPIYRDSLRLQRAALQAELERAMISEIRRPYA